ncbi:hypothetical protein LINGRAHAP2_LOCUS25134 [Linum grandiflorum]
MDEPARYVPWCSVKKPKGPSSHCISMDQSHFNVLSEQERSFTCLVCGFIMFDVWVSCTTAVNYCSDTGHNILCLFVAISAAALSEICTQLTHHHPPAVPNPTTRNHHPPPDFTYSFQYNTTVQEHSRDQGSGIGFFPHYESTTPTMMQPWHQNGNNNEPFSTRNALYSDLVMGDNIEHSLGHDLSHIGTWNMSPYMDLWGNDEQPDMASFYDDYNHINNTNI